MITRLSLLADLQKLLVKLQEDLRARCVERPEIEAPLRVQYEAARTAKRTAEAYETWREAQFTQAAVAWILSCVFIRFLEDNGLLGDTAYLSGPGPRLALARDQHTIYFRQHPTESDREYLYHVFRTVRRLPGVAALFHDTHNAVWHLGLSGDGAQLLVEFWQKLKAEEDQDQEHAPLAHDFSDPTLDTRFLGDLYQDLSEEAKKRFALLQTPIFIEEFILDRTLTPAIETFGYETVRMIDPTCGSAHFLLGGFHRLFALHQRNHPAVEVRALAQRALDQVFGVDLNPFAVAIARFRLLLAALHVCEIHQLADSPAFEVHAATGDSLLHGNPPGWDYRRQSFLGGHDALEDTLRHFYETEDAELARRYLSQDYHAVVGNPPYITVKDKALNEAYRLRFESCHQKYSLAVPFMEQFFALAVKGKDTIQAGFVGMITSNSFMKREFGKKLIEQFVPNWNFTHVLDTAGAFIPGHGTPTVILFGTNRKPVQPTIRTVMGIRGEPTTPEDPACGLVWTAIMAQVDHPGTQGDFVSVADVPRDTFARHPWSIGGGGAAELKEALDEGCEKMLGQVVDSIGITSFTLEDDVYIQPRQALLRCGLKSTDMREMVEGDNIRDWRMRENDWAVFPYDESLRIRMLEPPNAIYRFLWPARTNLSNNKMFGQKTKIECGLKWYEYGRLTAHKLQTPLSLAYAAVASHNHFLLDRGGKVFKQSALILKLPNGGSEHECQFLLGILNSSLGCFWIKQVCYPKASASGDISKEKGKPEANRYDINGSALLKFPLPASEGEVGGRIRLLAAKLDSLASLLEELEPHTIVAKWSCGTATNLVTLLEEAERRYGDSFRQMVFLQEELDWTVYELYGLTGGAAVSLANTTEWNTGIDPSWRPFLWQGPQPPQLLPGEVIREYRQRHALISTQSQIALMETKVAKRLWLGQQGVYGSSTSTYSDRRVEALRNALLGRLEDARHWPVPELTSCAHLADKVRSDRDFMEVATLYRGRPDFDITELVTDLVEGESVPFLPVLRYKESGLRKRAVWEQVWEMQRREDAIDVRTELSKDAPNYLAPDAARALKLQQVGDIPVPPKYDTKDFVSNMFWRLRGKLDVSKERFITYPHCNRDADRTPVIGWAGWDHLQQAQAVAGYYERMRTSEGWTDDRLLPLLAGVLELLPWLLQWHNSFDPQYQMGLGDFFRSFAEDEARRMGKTLDEVRAWRPAAKPARQKSQLGFGRKNP